MSLVRSSVTRTRSQGNNHQAPFASEVQVWSYVFNWSMVMSTEKKRREGDEDGKIGVIKNRMF